MSTNIPIPSGAPVSSNSSPQAQGKSGIAPPEEAFWIRYSPHHEMPLSGVSSFALHAYVIGILIIIGLGLIQIDKTLKPIPLDAVRVNLGGGGGSKSGVGEGPGIGHGPEAVQGTENTQATAPDVPKMESLKPV